MLDFPGQLTAQRLMAKHVLVAAGTQTAAGVDLRDYVGNVMVTIAAIQGSADATIVFSILDSSDNSTFATFAGQPTPITSTATNIATWMTVDTRNCQRYIQAKVLTTSTTATYDVGIMAVGLKQNAP